MLIERHGTAQQIALHVRASGLTHEVEIPAGKRPLFVLLDGTWSEARKMFRKSPYLDGFPVLGLRPEHVSRYRLRCALLDAHLCTAEVAALCLALAGEDRAARALDAWLDVFIEHNLDVRSSRPPNVASEAHARLAAIVAGERPGPATC